MAKSTVSELVFASRETERFPAFARALTGSIRVGGASSLITSETTMLGPTAEPLAHLSFLFHNVILVRYIEIESEIRRAISILKMRLQPRKGHMGVRDRGARARDRRQAGRPDGTPRLDRAP